MNLRKMTLRYMGWCPGMDAASRFRSRALLQTPSVPHFGVLSTLAMLLVGPSMFLPHVIYAASIFKSGSEFLTNDAMMSVFSFIIMSLSLALAYRWFRPMTVNRFEVNVKNLINLLFATYSLSLIWINSYLLVFFTPYYVPLWLLNKVYLSRYLHTLYYMLKIASGFLLLKISSNIVRRPDLNGANTRLISLALGGIGLAGLTIALTDIIEHRITQYAPLEIATRYVIPVMIPCAAILLFACDIFIRRRVRHGIGPAILYLALAIGLFDHIWLLLKRVVLRVTLQRHLSLITSGSYLTAALDMPAPGLVAMVLAAIGILLFRSGRGSPGRLKTLYSIAVISCGLANIYGLRSLPVFLRYYLRDIANFVSFEALSQVSNLPTHYIWLSLFRVFEGSIILALGALCLREPAVAIDAGRTHGLGGD